MVVEGVVEFVQPDGDKIFVIALAGHKPGRTVACKFNKPPEQKPAEIQKGQKIKIRGTCSGAGQESITVDGCTIVEVRPAPSPSEKPKDKESRKTLPRQEAIAVTAMDLFKEFQADAKTVQAKYDKKVLEVAGSVITADCAVFGGKPTICLKGSPKVNPVDPHSAAESVFCQFAAEDENKVIPLVRGQHAKIVGRFAGSAVGAIAPLLTDCELLETGPSPAVRVSAAQLTKDFADCGNDFGKKFETGKKYDKPLIVEGTVVDISNEPNRPFVTFRLAGFDEKAANPVRLEVMCLHIHNEGIVKQLSSVKKGDKITVKGTWVALPQGKLPELNLGVLLPAKKE